MAQSIKPTAAQTWGEWEGWGVSIAWWGNTAFGPRTDVADLVWTNKTTTVNGLDVPGLNLNIARFNVGGCSWNTITNGSQQISMVASPNIPKYKQIPGYWLDYHNEDPTSDAWDWTVNANQTIALQNALARGAHSEAFSNSPMWWALINRNPSGATIGSNDNLRSDMFRAHAAYMAAVALHFKSAGMPFATVEATNEPTGSWGANGNQEGCHVSHDAQAALQYFLRAELDARGLQSTPIAASDESQYDQALATWRAWNTTTRGIPSAFNLHGYEYNNGNRAALYAEVTVAGGKRIRGTEYGDGDASGVQLTQGLLLDFTVLHPTSWCYWQVFDESTGWALFPASNYAAGTLTRPNPKWYVIAHFSRHIRAGMTIISAGDAAGHTAAAYDAASSLLVLVSAPPGAGSQTYDLSAFGTVTGPITRWVTETGGGDMYRRYDDITLVGKTFTAPFAARDTVQTFEIRGVNM